MCRWSRTRGRLAWFRRATRSGPTCVSSSRTLTPAITSARSWAREARMNVKDVLAAKGRRLVTVSAKSSVADAIRTMHAEKVGAVLVPDAESCPVGIFTERDVVRLYAD